SDMSCLPEPRPPAGIGYSYLDWFGAYNMATAALAALYRRATTGRGCHVDASQAEVGIFLTGTAVLDHSVNGRRWSRYGNRSPWRLAAPHGAYPTRPAESGAEDSRGKDRWIAIAAFTDAEWRAVASALGHPEWLDDPRFDGLSNRRANEDALDDLIAGAMGACDGADLKGRLRAAGVRPGFAQRPRVATSPASASGMAGRVAANRARQLADEGLPCAPRPQPGTGLRPQLQRGYRARSLVGFRAHSRAGGRAARG
ncbi:MAG: CoA transferase, partial [Alphaproteobacteria bacterium]|nr:CoA transferase [Alphaproteobacteria bacterium]